MRDREREHSWRESHMRRGVRQRERGESGEAKNRKGVVNTNGNGERRRARESKVGDRRRVRRGSKGIRAVRTNTLRK